MLVVAILLVATGFAFLTSQVQTTQVLVRSTLSKNFRPAYDLLVLPPKSETHFERSTGLVDENYLSGLFGGISDRQLAQIRSVPGVALAAPVAMVGYTFLTVSLQVPLTSVQGNTPAQLFSVRQEWTAENGLSHYPSGAQQYYYWQAQLASAPTPGAVCAAFKAAAPGSRTGALLCSSISASASRGSDPEPVATVRIQVPILLAAVDPESESQLVGLRHAMVSGRYLREGEGDLPPAAGFVHLKEVTVPVIAADRTYVDQEIDVVLSRLETLTSTELTGASVYKLVTTDGPATTKTVAVPTQDAYRHVLAGTLSFSGKSLIPIPYFFRTTQIRYLSLGHDRLVPVRVRVPRSAWTAPSGGSALFGNIDLMPPGANGTTFRGVRLFAGAAQTRNGVITLPQVKIVGTFDPTKLVRFSKLSHVPLGTFFPTLAYGANKRSRRLLHTKPLGPTTNIAGYLSQPPLLLTTLQAAKPFFKNAEYSTTNLSPGARKPISAIQVRISGLGGASDKSFSRLRQLAVAIEEKTGLTVEITAGSSPKKITIDLPKGRFGRPALEISQGWVQTNTAAVLLKGIDKESLTLWALVVVVCALFVGNAVVADLRSRRRELAILVTVGWSRAELSRLAFLEVAAIGLVAGLAGTVLAVVLVEGFGLHLALANTLFVTPAGLVLSLLAGTGPVLRATRSLRPLELVRTPPAETAVRRSVKGLTVLALSATWRRRGRSVIGVLVIAVGVGAAAYLVGIEAAFHGEVVGTLLGNAVDLQVRGADLLALVLIGVVAAGVIADLSYLSLKEREAQLATLRALGWTVFDVGRLIATEALVVAVLGGIAGAGAGYGILAALHAPARTAVPTAIGALVAGVVLALCSSLLPLSWWSRSALAERLVEL